MSDSINPYAPPQVDVLPPIDPSKHERLATAWRRLGASIIDTIILVVVLLPVMWFGGYISKSFRGQVAYTDEVLWSAISLGFFAALNWAHLARGQTIGKRMLGLKVVSKSGEEVTRNHILLRRSLPVQIASLIPMVGIIMVIIDCLFIFRVKRNTLHDDIADTKVVDLRPAGA